MADEPAHLPAHPEAVRDPSGRFLRGPGRRSGSRNRYSRALAMAVLEDFAEHRAAVLKRLRQSHTQAYAALVSRLLPRGADLAADDEGGEDEALLPACIAETAPEAPAWSSVSRDLDRLERLVLAEYSAHEREPNS